MVEDGYTIQTYCTPEVKKKMKALTAKLRTCSQSEMDSILNELGKLLDQCEDKKVKI